MTSEADILNELIDSDDGTMSVECARTLLRLHFSERAKRRMRLLLKKGNSGQLTSNEEIELDRFRRVGMMVDLMKAKARLTLSRQQRDAS